jgi:hypothetical protein
MGMMAVFSCMPIFSTKIAFQAKDSEILEHFNLVFNQF